MVKAARPAAANDAWDVAFLAVDPERAREIALETDASPEEVSKAMIANTPPEGYAACCGVIERTDLRPSLAAISSSVSQNDISSRMEVLWPPIRSDRVCDS